MQNLVPITYLQFPKPHKFKAKKTMRNGTSYPSELEADVHDYFLFLKRIGEIKEVKHYDTVRLTKYDTYKVDFVVIGKNDEKYWVEAKGIRTNDWLRKCRIWKDGNGPGRLEVWVRGRGGKVVLAETILPNKD